MLLSGGYSARDRGEDRAPFIVESAQALADLRTSGAVGVAVGWSPGSAPDPDAARAFSALCAANPGPAPLFVEWSDGNGTTTRLRSRAYRVSLDDRFLTAIRELLGSDRVRLVKAR